MSRDTVRVQRELARSGRDLRPAPRWTDEVRLRIEAQETCLRSTTADTAGVLARVVEEVGRSRVPNLRLVMSSVEPAETAPAAPSRKRYLAAPLVAAGTAFAMAAAMMLVLLSQSQSAQAEKRLQLAAAKIEKLHVEIDLRLQEIDQEHEEGRTAFRQLWYAKDANACHPHAQAADSCERSQACAGSE